MYSAVQNVGLVVGIYSCFTWFWFHYTTAVTNIDEWYLVKWFESSRACVSNEQLNVWKHHKIGRRCLAVQQSSLESQSEPHLHTGVKRQNYSLAKNFCIEVFLQCQWNAILQQHDSYTNQTWEKGISLKPNCDWLLLFMSLDATTTLLCDLFNTMISTSSLTVFNAVRTFFVAHRPPIKIFSHVWNSRKFGFQKLSQSCTLNHHHRCHEIKTIPLQ